MDLNTFMNQFHNINGTNLGEKKKNFNLLLKTIPPDHDALLSLLVPKSHFEHLLKLKLLLKLQRIPDLLQILKSEEEYLPAKLLKNKWFCQQLAKILDENSTGFVDGILPHTSYVIRRRIITKLATYGTKLDQVFEEVCARYGIHIAANLLVACSAPKIEQVQAKIVLTPFCQKLLYHKQPQLFAQYIKYDKSIDYCVMNYVARSNINEFVELIKSSNLGAHLGKHLTRKLLTNLKEVVIVNADIFSRVVHLKTVIKTLTDEELKRFFFKCCPESIDKLRYYAGVGFYQLSDKLGTRYYQLLLETSEKKWNKSLYDFPNLISDKMMEMMDVEERLKWVSIKNKNGTSEDDLLPFLRAEDAIALIKRKINVTSSITGRDELVQLLLKTCQVNGDLNALAEVGEYVCSRHRNDNELILNNFFHMMQVLFQLEKFGQRHWDFINSLSKVTGKNCWYMRNYSVKYIEFLFHEKKLTEEKIHEFLKGSDRERYETQIEELKKLLLLKNIELLPTLLGEKEKIEYADLKLLNHVFLWNKVKKHNQIPIFEHPRLIQSLKQTMKDAAVIDYYVPELYVLSWIFASIICCKDPSDLRDETIKSYFFTNYRFYNLDVDMWLLKHQPSVIEAHFDKFLNHLFYDRSRSLRLLTYIKKFTSPSFQQKIVSHAFTSLTKHEHIDVVFHVFVILESPENFLQHIAPFYPPGSKIDCENEEREKADIPIAIAQSFKYSTSSLVLPTLILYCKGDFLGYALESLYYLFYHSPENQLSDFINNLSSKAVSVRKHSIFLTCTIGTVNDVQKLLKRFIENERNVSVQKHLFTAALKYFIKNPSDEFWECVKVCMSKLDKNDSESFKMLVDLNQIPDKYKARHVVFVWDILKKKEANRPRLLTSIPHALFKDLPLEFLVEVITENFLQSGSSCTNVVNDFVVTSLRKTECTEQILGTIFEMMKQIKISGCALDEEASNRRKLSSFVESLVSSSISDENAVLSVFSQRWHELFSANQMMRENLRLSFALFYLQGGKDLMKFGDAVADFLDEVVTTYGVVIVDCFASVLNESLQTFLFYYTEANENFFKFVLHLIKSRESLVFHLLAIKLLPEKPPGQDAKSMFHEKSAQDDAKKVFHEVVQVLRQVPQESIQMLMNLYVMDLEFD